REPGVLVPHQLHRGTDRHIGQGEERAEGVAERVEVGLAALGVTVGDASLPEVPLKRIEGGDRREHRAKRVVAARTEGGQLRGGPGIQRYTVFPAAFIRFGPELDAWPRLVEPAIPPLELTQFVFAK